MEFTGGNKRRRIRSSESLLLTDLPEGVLEHITTYLPNPTRLLFAVALTRPSASMPSSRTLAIMSTTPEWHDTEGKLSGDELSTCDSKGNWSRLDFADFGEELASRLNDGHVQRILEYIYAKDSLVTLHLTGCLSLVGHCLEVLKGSTVLQHFDMSLVMYDDATISPEPPISENIVLPLLASIIGSGQSSVELLCFPKKWRLRNSLSFQYFIQRYSEYLGNRSQNCGCRSDICRRLCQDVDAMTPRAWVIQNPHDFPHVTQDFVMKKYGLQRFTCHKCFDLICYDCAVGNCNSCYYIPKHCVRCEKDYCRECCVGTYSCSICEDYLCKGCEETGAFMIPIGNPKCPAYACNGCYNAMTAAMTSSKLNWLIGWTSAGA